MKAKTHKPPTTAAAKLECDCSQAANEILARTHVHGLDNQRVHDYVTARILKFVGATNDNAARAVKAAQDELAELRKENRDLKSQRQKMTQLWVDARKLARFGRHIGIRSYMQRFAKTAQERYQVVWYVTGKVLGEGKTPIAAMTDAMARDVRDQQIKEEVSCDLPADSSAPQTV